MISLDRRFDGVCRRAPSEVRSGLHAAGSQERNSMSRRTVLCFSLVTLIAACSHAPPQTATVTQQGRRFDPDGGINPAELRRDLFAFADDSFHGRETGTADAQRAAAFLARRVQQLGLEPAGDSLYMQRVPLVRETFARTTELSVVLPNGQRQPLTIGS